MFKCFFNKGVGYRESCNSTGIATDFYISGIDISIVGTTGTQ